MAKWSRHIRNSARRIEVTRLLFRFRRYEHALSAQILGELRIKN